MMAMAPRRNIPPLPKPPRDTNFKHERSTIENLLISNDLVAATLFEFLPNHSFRFIAGVSRTFRSIYGYHRPNDTTTSIRNGVSTPSTTKLMIKDRLPRSDVAVYSEYAARYGCRETLEYTLRKTASRNYLSSKCCHAAAASGELVCLLLAHNHGCPWTASTCAAAAGAGQLTCLRYLHTHGCAWDERTAANAAENGRIECLKYAISHQCSWKHKTAALLAAENGHLHCLRYLHTQFLLGNHFDREPFWGPKLCSIAAAKGHLHILEYAHTSGCPWNSDTCYSAAWEGQLECLMYAHVNGCPMNSMTTAFAARGNHIACLRYAHLNGCPWDSSTAIAARANGAFECLSYALVNGCPDD